MKTLISIILLVISSSLLAQQKETFGLATFTVPAGWQKLVKDNDAIGYSTTNAQTGTYCQIAIYKSMKSLGSSQLDFEAEWKDLIADVFQVTVKPETRSPLSDDGWETISGFAPFIFNEVPSIAMLVTISGYKKRVSIVVLSNTQVYKTEIERFLESVELRKPKSDSSTLDDRKTDMPPFIGTWVKSSGLQQAAVDAVSTANSGYIKDQYTFNMDGTYNFVSKIFTPSVDKISLIKENGTFRINGNSLTINPQKSIIEKWSKKNGTDTFDKLISTEQREPENATYKFSRRYFPGIQEWNLILQSGKPTRRDGSFNSNTISGYTWYYFPASDTNPGIALPASNVVP